MNPSITDSVRTSPSRGGKRMRRHIRKKKKKCTPILRLMSSFLKSKSTYVGNVKIVQQTTVLGRLRGGLSVACRKL